MAYYVRLYVVTLIALVAIDMAWIGLVARSFYRSYLGFLMAARVNWLAAAIFYLLFVLGILVFVVLPGLDGHSVGASLLRAALFGLVAYATYDLTNLATIKGWPAIVTVVDLAWGTVVSVVVSYVGLTAGRLFR